MTSSLQSARSMFKAKEIEEQRGNENLPSWMRIHAALDLSESHNSQDHTYFRPEYAEPRKVDHTYAYKNSTGKWTGSKFPGRSASLKLSRIPQAHSILKRSSSEEDFLSFVDSQYLLYSKSKAAPVYKLTKYSSDEQLLSRPNEESRVPFMIDPKRPNVIMNCDEWRRSQPPEGSQEDLPITSSDHNYAVLVRDDSVTDVSEIEQNITRLFTSEDQSKSFVSNLQHLQLSNQKNIEQSKKDMSNVFNENFILEDHSYNLIDDTDTATPLCDKDHTYNHREGVFCNAKLKLSAKEMRDLKNQLCVNKDHAYSTT